MIEVHGTIKALKPCPFCGGKAGRLRSWSGRLSMIVCCLDQECLGHHQEQDEQGGWSHEADTLTDAVIAWNRRAALQEASNGDNLSAK